MLKLFFSFSMMAISLYGSIYYSKVEPIQTKIISSNVTGEVLFINENLLGQQLADEVYIIIDSKLDRDELKAVNQKISYTKTTLEINHKILDNLKETLTKKESNYKKVQNLKIKSTLEKNREFYDVVATQNLFLSTQKEINTLHTQLSDLEFRKLQLQKSIHDKNITSTGYFLYEINVKVGEVVNKATPLAKVLDISKAILTIYLNEKDLATSDTNSIYLNDKKTKYKISRLSIVADAKNISKYKAQIIIDAPKVFSKLIKIQLKDK